MTSTVLVQHRPVTAFANLARPNTASAQQRPSTTTSVAAAVQEQRRSSIQRTLHPNQFSSSAGSSSGSAAASPRKRKSGPPRSFSTPVAPLASLADFDAVPVATSVKLTPLFCSSRLLTTMIPLIRPLVFFWKTNAEIENVQTALQRAHLVFTVDVDLTGPIFDKVDIAFQNHCQANKIDYISTTYPSAVPTPNTTSWGLLGPKGRSAAGGRTWVDDPKSLTRFTFNLQALRSSPFSHTPNNLGEGPFIFRRDSAIFTDLSTVYLIHRTVVRNMFSPTAALHVVFYILSSLPSVVTRSLNVDHLAHRLPMLFNCPHLALLLRTSLPNQITDDANILQHVHSDNGTETVGLNTHFVPPTSSTIVTRKCFFGFFAGRPTGLKFKELLQEQFPSPRPSVDGDIRDEMALLGLHVSIGPGVGKGPRNELVAQAIKIIMADGHYWTERETYMTLRLHPSRTPIPTRSCVLKATGFLFLLHFLFVGVPIPASPFLFSTLFDGRQTASKFDLDFLARFISPESVSLIKRIGHIPLDQPLYTSQAEDCIEFQYLLNIPEVDPTMISSRRSQHEHDGIISSVISFVTLGSVDIEHHPDFFMVVHGFNACVDAFAGQDRPHHILEWFATPCRELIMAAWDRQVKAPADILSHLEFTQTNPAVDPWEENGVIVELITCFFIHYLSEPGHPTDPNRVFEALIDDDFDSNDPLLPVKLFLSVLTGSTLLPIQLTWNIRCLITHDWSEEYPTIDADGHEDFGPDVSVSFRSCFRSFTITNNARLRLLLLCEVPEDGRDTELGRYIHGQLLASRHTYTTA
ncbi:hypothetical protein MVEN_00128500 [Mycena venus]|uniref:Uncharacterized protein n=1 Tax=Mycena venus TaxID=2733690 RepID=A0A8H7DEN3_9AGAR|nr:hypothetical protein MVEN_00128500 [Mycena venus]